MKKLIVQLSAEETAYLKSLLNSRREAIVDPGAAKVSPEANRLADICNELDDAASEDRFMGRWQRPEIDEDGKVFNIPTDEAEEVLVRRKSGGYLVDEVCCDTVYSDEETEEIAYWLDRTQDWEDVDVWAHLPEER